MDDSYFVNVLDACDELVEHAGCLCLVDALVLNDIVEEFAPFHELHHQE